MSKSVNLMVVSDEEYAVHACTCIYSALKNTSGAIKIYLIDDGISREKWKVIKGICEKRSAKMKKIEFEKNIDSFARESKHLAKSAYIRLFITDLIPSKEKRVIYLDADMIVESDLRTLWNVSLEGNSTAAVQDFGIPQIGARGGVEHASELGLDYSEDYFNSGLMLINLERWREKGIGSKAIDYLKRYDEDVSWADQEALNVVLDGDWLSLNRRWNVPPFILNMDYWEYLEQMGEAEEKETSVPVPPAVIHFAGVHKPWKFGADVVWQDRYFHYLRDSGWFDSEMDWLWWRARSALRYGKERLGDLHRETKKRLGSG